MNVFVDRLRELMEFKSLNIVQLAKNVNIPRSTISCWLLKTRLPKIDAVVQLADYFNVTTDYLLGREDI